MKKKIIIPIAILLILVGGIVFLYKKFIIWEEEPKVVLKDNIEMQVTNSSQDQDKPSVPEDKKEPLNVSVKGKITVSATRENGLPLDKAIFFLESGGKRIRETTVEKTVSVIFDQIGAGNYTVGAYREGDGRIVSKQITLGEGEIVSVSLAIFLDTEVKITVSVKNSSGDALANQSFQVKRTDGLGYSVNTNSQGIFVVEKIPPDDNWRLFKDGKEVAHFKVAPTGQDQTINVQTTGS